jgi:hypothetical protein
VLWNNARNRRRTSRVHHRRQGATRRSDGRHRLKRRTDPTVAVEKLTGAKFAYLPYTSGGEATQLVGNTLPRTSAIRRRISKCGAPTRCARCACSTRSASVQTKVAGDRSWNDVPTCKEEGLDVQYLMLRAVFLPGKVRPRSAFYVDLFKKVSQTAEFKDYLEKQALKPITSPGLTWEVPRGRRQGEFRSDDRGRLRRSNASGG